MRFQNFPDRGGEISPFFAVNRGQSLCKQKISPGDMKSIAALNLLCNTVNTKKMLNGK